MSIFSKLISNQYYFNGNGYVRDGLIFMFDGIWNAGRNKHDANAQFIMNLVDGKKYPLHDFVNRYSYDDNCLTLKSLNNSSLITEAQLKETALTVEIRFSFSTDNIEELKTFFKVSNNTFVTRKSGSSNRFSFVTTRYKEDDTSKIQMYSYFFNISRIQPDVKTFCIGKDSLLVKTPLMCVNGLDAYPGDAIWADTSYSEASDFVESFDIQFNSLPNGIDAYIYAIRIYNRKLSDSEIYANAQLDNSRFNIV